MKGAESLRFKPSIFMFITTLLAGLVLASPVSGSEASGDAYKASDCGNETNRVLLTYDDWPYDNSVTRLLRHARQLRSLNVGAMYFPIGGEVASYREAGGINVPAKLRRIRQMVGNHSWTHPHLPDLTKSQIRNQVDYGVSSTQFRHPYGDRSVKTLGIVESKGYHDCSWDVDTADWTGKSAAQVCKFVVRNTGPGDTVLMHMRKATFRATGCIVEGLRAKRVDGKRLRLCRPWRDAQGEPARTPVYLPYSISC